LPSRWTTAALTFCQAPLRRSRRAGSALRFRSRSRLQSAQGPVLASALTRPHPEQRRRISYFPPGRLITRTGCALGSLLIGLDGLGGGFLIAIVHPHLFDPPPEAR
jgi:hypothetical protein